MDSFLATMTHYGSSPIQRQWALSYPHLWHKAQQRGTKVSIDLTVLIHLSCLVPGEAAVPRPSTPGTRGIVLSAVHNHLINSWVCVWPKMQQSIRKSVLITFKNRCTHDAKLNKPCAKVHMVIHQALTEVGLVFLPMSGQFLCQI